MSKQSILDALVSLVAEKGTDGLSVRAVATRAGVSIGTVQYHFPTKAEMLFAALDVVSETAKTTFEAVVERKNPVERLHGILDLLIPQKKGDRVSLVWLACASRAAYDDDIRMRYENMWGRMRTGISRALLAVNPQMPAVEAEEKAVELLALADGLALTILAEPSNLDPTIARRIVHRHAAVLVESGRE